MGMNTIIKRGILFSALVLSAFCLFLAGSGGRNIAKKTSSVNNGTASANGDSLSASNEPIIINNEPIVYLDNTDQISVQGEGIRSVAYSSSNQKVAKISKKGKITPKKKGEATIRARVAYHADGQDREASLSYSLKILGESKEYFMYYYNDPTWSSAESEIIGLTEAGKKLKDVYIPERYVGKKVKLIHADALSDSPSMERLYISDYVESTCNSEENDFERGVLPDHPDGGCSQLREIHLGKRVADFGISDKLPKLEKITVASGNKTYHAQDGVLFKGKETLTLYPAGKKDASYAIPKSVTQIERLAFAWAKNLKRVEIPKEIKALEETFQHSGLREVALPAGLENSYAAFQDCAALEKAVIPSLPNSIYISRAFRNCPSLKTVQMEDLPKGFYGDNFAGCRSLEKIHLSRNAKEILQKDDVLFDSSMETLLLYPAGKKDQHYRLPEGVRRIQENAFAGAQHISEVTLNKELREIGENAFQEAKINQIHFNDGLQKIEHSSFYKSNLAEAILPDSITDLGIGAFLECRKLRSVKLPPNIEELANTFTGCSSLRTLHIPKKIKKMINGAGLCGSITTGSAPNADGSQDGCTSLTSITVEKGNKYFATAKGVLFNKAKTTLIVYPAAKKNKKYSVPKSVKKISYGAFAGCNRLRELSMKDGVTNCGEYSTSAFFNMRSLRKIKLSKNLKCLYISAFSGCPKLQEIRIPDKVKRIDTHAFDGCASLKSVTLGKNVRLIESRAFRNCRSLRKIRFPDRVRQIEEYAFDGCTSLKRVIFGKNVSTINAYAFRDCRNLRKAVFQKKMWGGIKWPAEFCFQRAGSSNDRKLVMHVPKKWKKKKKVVLKWFLDAGLSKKTKIKYY